MVGMLRSEGDWAGAVFAFGSLVHCVFFSLERFLVDLTSLKENLTSPLHDIPRPTPPHFTMFFFNVTFAHTPLFYF